MIPRVNLSTVSDRPVRCRGRVLWPPFGLWAALVVTGCHHEAENHYTSVGKPPTVQLVQPQIRDIVRVIGQPSFTQSYERSSVYPKMNAYIQKWIVDIGDKVKKGDVLATLFVPELVEDHGTKKATVVLDQEKIALAKVVVEVAEAEVEAALARLDEARADFASNKAEADRWDAETKRLENELKRGVVNPQDVLQASNRWKAMVASRETANASVLKAEAELLARRAALAKAKVDVRVAEADLKVAESEEKRLQAWVDYLVLPAPYDGVIVARNANTFDFVLPTTGDPSALSRGPYMSASGSAAPIYVVDRTDIVRVFVDIPEQDANYVQIGSKATVLVRAFREEPIPGTVTRTSWALNVKSRTLRAEIDLPNPGSKLLPGMYAYTKVMIERHKVRTLPVSALMHLGDKTVLQVGETSFCWIYNDGRAKRIEVETGVSDGEWIEITNRRAVTSQGEEPWTPFDGTEQVILGNLSILVDNGPVQIAPETDTSKANGAAAAANRVVRPDASRAIQRVAGGGPVPTGGR
ncbi:MAG TPA: efflux RND transporter periplasmic adaptor subunit [Isosphaeraceae bacterium]|nr:efflux RND transporter periplasmic adaptor subunit [Isosphaeraceae bacterium]